MGRSKQLGGQRGVGRPSPSLWGHNLWTPLLLPLQDHCFYQGHVEGHPDSAASLSTCAGLRWVQRTNTRAPAGGEEGLSLG